MATHNSASNVSVGRRRTVRLVTTRQGLHVAEPGPKVKGPACAAQVLTALIGGADREHVVALHLNGAHRVVAAETVAVGTLNSAPVHPRELFKGAILANAAAIIVGHNHPSGELEPSSEDRALARRLCEVGTLLQLPVLDFIVVSSAGYYSFQEKGVLDA